MRLSSYHLQPQEPGYDTIYTIILHAERLQYDSRCEQSYKHQYYHTKIQHDSILCYPGIAICAFRHYRILILSPLKLQRIWDIVNQKLVVLDFCQQREGNLLNNPGNV